MTTLQNNFLFKVAAQCKNHTIVSDDGVMLNVETCGQGKPLLLFDGIMCDGHVWKYFIPAFSDYKIIHWHYPGHGLSGTASRFADLSISRLAADAQKILNSFDAAGAVLTGHSFGVAAALETARKYPELIKGLVLICGAPGRFIHNFDNSTLLTRLMPLLYASTALIPRQTMKLWRSLPAPLLTSLAQKSNFVNSRLVSIEDLHPYFEGMSNTHIGTVLRMLKAADRYDMFPLLESINTPALIIAGERDRFTPSHISRKMHHKLKNSQFMLAAAGTHSLPLEQPDLVNLKTKEFINSLPD